MFLTRHKTRSVFDRYDIVNEADLRDAVIRLVGSVRQHAKRTEDVQVPTKRFLAAVPVVDEQSVSPEFLSQSDGLQSPAPSGTDDRPTSRGLRTSSHSGALPLDEEANMLHLLFLWNSPTSIGIERDDRRFAFYDVSAADQIDTAHFKRLLAELTHVGRATACCRSRTTCRRTG
jgi:hypothetical protein